MEQVTTAKLTCSPRHHALQLFLREVNRFEPATPRKRWTSRKTIERGDRNAKALMVNANLRLVISIARRYQATSSRFWTSSRRAWSARPRSSIWRRGYKFN